MTYGILAALVDGLLVVFLGVWVVAVGAALHFLLFGARSPERTAAKERRPRSSFARCVDCNRIVWPAWASCPSCGADLGALG